MTFTVIYDETYIQCYSSADGSIMLRFQTASHRVTLPSLNDLVPENNDEECKNSHLDTGSAADVKPLTLILVPTGEEVVVINGQKSYKGVLLPAKKTDSTDGGRDGTIVGKKKKSSLPEKKVSESSVENIESILLTQYDLKNRKRGYSLFLPDNKEKFDEYWRVGYGIKLKLDGNSGDSKECEQQVSKRSNGSNGCRTQANHTGYNGYHLTEVTMELGDERIVPTQLLVRYGERTTILPILLFELFVTLHMPGPILHTLHCALISAHYHISAQLR
jgi:hypothetical protein